MNRKEKYSKENLEKIVKQANCIKDVLEKMNLKRAGGNYKAFHKYIETYEIDISHFKERENIYQRTLGIYVKENKKPLSEILIINSDYNRSHLKERLYKERLKKRFCEECGQGELWRGKKMSLILDHKNGVNNDNRLENLRILCPNCNATLETHCGKNNKKFLLKKEIYKNKNKKEINGVDGRQRAAIEKRKFTRPSLEQLQREVSEIGYSATGRKYGVSDNSIRKWIKTYEQYGV